MTKRTFVATKLQPLVQAINENVTRLEYVKAMPSGEEYVNIWHTWNDGFGQVQNFRKQVCVTACSLSAITTEVVKKATW